MENNYYEIIDVNRANYMINNRMISITDDQLKKLEHFIKNIQKQYYNDSVYYTLDDSLDYISAFEDEWFILDFKKNIYLCDQWEGLIKCIEDNYGK